MNPWVSGLLPGSFWLHVNVPLNKILKHCCGADRYCSGPRPCMRALNQSEVWM